MWRSGIRRLASIAVVAALTVSAQAQERAQQQAQESDDTRAVRIIDGPAGAGAAPKAAAPPAPVVVDQAALKADNSAGLTVDVLPGTELAAGTKISLRVTSRKPGYLVLLDVNAEGKLSQIYPNRTLLLAPIGDREVVNRIAPGRPLTVPDLTNPFTGFEFVAASPVGVAMVVAILSDRPVQVFDLPDVPAPLTGSADALKYLTDVASTLRVASTVKAGQFDQPQLSFDAKFYVIK